MNRPRGTGRWRQLVFGVVAMVAIANLQYGWTLFVGPIDARFHWGNTAIQVAFTIFVLTETWLVPIEGYLVDRFGPRRVVVVGGVLVGASWVLNSFATSLPAFYAAAVVGGVGAGAVYGTAVGNSLKWFTDRRGFAAGVTASGFGAGSALTVAPVGALIATSGYQAAFLRFGLLQGAVVLLCALFLRAPRPGELPAAPTGKGTPQCVRDFRPAEALRSAPFWIMYAMFVLVATGGLMVVAQLAPMAKDFKVANVPVSLLGITLPAVTFALSIDRVMNGFTRPFFGWISDHLGRERTMFGAFILEGIGILLLQRFAADPVVFVVLSGVVFFAWGEIYSLFPATCADVYGKRYCTTIYGLLYTAKGVAALLVPLSGALSATSGWSAVLVAAALMNFVAAAAALLVLKPARARAASTALIPDAMAIPRV
ncbi:MAG TPA: oxalate/formate MFS antiporter [Anaeromyxobacteraceae bacterium]|nr:oxalate/formate MFS antiporter [Anaeromyxobacteraceae bacterium]